MMMPACVASTLSVGEFAGEDAAGAPSIAFASPKSSTLTLSSGSASRSRASDRDGRPFRRRSRAHRRSARQSPAPRPQAARAGSVRAAFRPRPAPRSKCVGGWPRAAARIERGDVRMIERGQHLDPRSTARDQDRRQGVGQDLDGDAATELAVAGAYASPIPPAPSAEFRRYRGSSPQQWHCGVMIPPLKSSSRTMNASPTDATAHTRRSARPPSLALFRSTVRRCASRESGRTRDAE